MLLSTLATFFIALVIILISAKVFLDIAQKLAVQWQLSTLFISVIIIGLGANLPELTLTISSVIKQNPGLALGNMIGSSIVNITLILGLAIALGSVRIGTHKTQINALLLLCHSLLFIGLYFAPFEQFFKGIILIIGLLLSMTYQYKTALDGRKNEDRKILKKLLNLAKKEKTIPKWKAALLLLLSIAGLSLGGNFIVTAVENLSGILGITTTILGLTLTALSTSLPELVLTITAAITKKDKVVVGTLMGSNIFNLASLPAILFFSGQSFRINPVEFVFLMLTTISIVSLIFAYKGTTVPKLAGFTLMSIGALFFYFTFAAL